MSRSLVIPVALALGTLAAIPGCQQKQGAGLPPPAGSGAPAAAAIPRLSELATAGADTAPASPQGAWTGTLFARREAQLGPKMSGVITQLTVEEGDRVKKGQLLFRLDAGQASLGVSQARAAIASAQVGYDAAKLEYTRATELLAKGSIAPAAFDQAKSGHDRAFTGLEQAKVALQVAERGAADTAIYSPIDGVVTAKLKSLGETATMMPPTVVLVVQDVDSLELRAKLPEKALATLQVGSVLRISVPTVGITRDVPVKRINPTLDARTRTVEVVADVENADQRLKVGMLVEVALGGPTAATSGAKDREAGPAGEPARAASAGETVKAAAARSITP